jgi:manganese oxidase
MDSKALWKLTATAALLAASTQAEAVIICARTITADVVAFDQPIMFNRLGAANVNGMMYALRRDVINKVTRVPLTLDPAGAMAGQVELRPDKRPRPIVLRVAAGDCLQVTLTNLLAPQANPNNALPNNVPPFNVPINDQAADRHVGFHVAGMQLVNSIADDSSMVGRVVADPGSLVPVGQTRTYVLFAEKEGGFVAQSYGAPFGSQGTTGNQANGLFGQVNVQPKRARIFRSAVTEEELRLATVGMTPDGHPIVNYEARYPNVQPWIAEGKANLPILNMIDGTRIVHTDIDAIVAGPNADGTFPPDTYPLESVGRRNPSVPNRLEPFREFASQFHDEVAAAQAFPGFFDEDPVFEFVLEGVRDAFMINYGSAGIGSEIIANRLRVGPMHDCLDCAFEEFFLSSWAIADPATLVDVPANVGLENLRPGQSPRRGTTGPKANFALFPADPANVHHSYINDFVKFRNTHIGKEQHVFHLHNHQWLFDANDDNSNYLDVQGIGPNAGYTYEIAFGGAGNRNKTTGDAIFHCHFYPHFAMGMWYLWRDHDVFEAGTRLQVSGTGFHTAPFALKDGTPAAGARALPDGEIVFGVPIPAIVPLPGKAMAPLPGRVTVKPNPFTTAGGRPTGSLANVIDRNINPGYPFWLAGMEHTVGQRATTPPLDMVTPALAQQLRDSGNPLFRNLDPAQADGFDGGLPRHSLHGFAAGGVALEVLNRLDFSKEIEVARPQFFPEQGIDLEQVAMAFHAVRNHPSFAVDLNRNVVAKNFITNGSGGPSVGAPFHEPCIDDIGQRLNNGVTGVFFSGESLNGLNTRGSSFFTAERPRV